MMTWGMSMKTESVLYKNEERESKLGSSSQVRKRLSSSIKKKKEEVVKNNLLGKDLNIANL